MMKTNKYTYIYAGLVVVAGIILYTVNRPDDLENYDEPGVTQNIEPSQSVSASATPMVTPKLSRASAKPTPGLAFSEVKDYKYWADMLDPLYRHLILDKDCTYMEPSQVSYPNNTKVMIDNGYSSVARIIKIGDGEYYLDAGGWILATLSSKSLPAGLKISCGSMELGRIDLE